MMAATKTRSQRRMEKKQALIILVLVLAVSLASFTLGVVVGRRGAERDLAAKQQKAEKILVAQVPQKAPAVEQKSAAAVIAPPAGEALEQEVKLTFYDKLAKEESVPIGSGINMPPQETPPKAAVTPPIPLPEKPIVKKKLPVATVAKLATPAEKPAAIMPKVDPRGGYSVQVGSFAGAGDAGALKQRLLDKHYPAFVVEADLGAKGLWYRVRLGPYKDAEAAKSIQQLVEKKEQMKGFITRQ